MTMTNIDRSQFYSGGFFLIRAIDTPDGLDDDDLLPEKIISLSTCFCPRFQIHWNMKLTNADSCIEFGVSEAKIKQFEKWCNDHWFKGIEIGGMFNSIVLTREFVDEFIPDTTNLYLIEVGLHEYLGKNNWREQIPVDSSKVGVDLRIQHKLPMSTGGTVLGFEVVSYLYHDFSHSWLCNYIHRDMYELYNIKPNEFGFIDNFDDAKKTYEWIEEDKRGRRGEYREPYDFWLIVSHPLGDNNHDRH